MHQIYKKLNLRDELADLEADWQTVDPLEVERLKGVTKADMDTLGEEVENSVTLIDRKIEKEKTEKWFQKVADAVEKGAPPPEDEQLKDPAVPEELEFNEFFGTYGKDALSRISSDTLTSASKAANIIPEDEEFPNSGPDIDDHLFGEDDDEEQEGPIFGEDETDKAQENNWRIFPNTNS